MLKYFQKSKGRHNIGSDDDVIDVDVVKQSNGISNAEKRYSLRSTSSFCDEIFLDELLANNGATVLSSPAAAEEDAISYGALSVDALSDAGCDTASSTAGTLTVGPDKDLFKYHSRLSMNLKAIIAEPNCLSYFIQYLEEINMLSLIKFYLDTENFRNAALVQLKKQHGDNSNDLENQSNNCKKSKQSKKYVPELKTLCDVSMHKPITDDEKSKIFAETSKQLTIDESNDKQTMLSRTSSQTSLASLANSVCSNEVLDGIQISAASVKDALVIYRKYLITNASMFVELPVDIISKISLKLCEKANTVDQSNSSNELLPITAECFVEAQQFILAKLEANYLNDFLQSTYYCKYCIELVESCDLKIYDILYSETTLFYFMEYLEQQGERNCLDFWSAAINYRKGYLQSEGQLLRNEREIQADAMIIYEKFFSLQAGCDLWACSKLRAYVESTICSDGWVSYCFDLPLKVVANYLERKHLATFFKSSLFSNYISELKSRIIADKEDSSLTSKEKLSQRSALKRSTSMKLRRQYCHRKTLSDCVVDEKLTISQQNTLLASMDNQIPSKFHLNIESSQLTNPDLLWQRSTSNGKRDTLTFGRVNALGRFERDFIPACDAYAQYSLKHPQHHWSLALHSNKIKNAMRKLIHLPVDNMQEEIAWQVAEMIVKDVTNVTMAKQKSL